MNYGQGAITFTSKGGGGGGGGVLDMRNGLSKIGTFGELGLNPLLHNTFVELAAFDFNITQTGNPLFHLSPGTGQVWLANSGFSQRAGVFFNGNISTIGAFGSLGTPGTRMNVDDTNDLIEWDSFRSTIFHHRFLNFNNNTGIFKYGDLDNLTTGVTHTVTRATSRFQFSNNTGQFVDFFGGALVFSFGDLSDTSNGIKFGLNDGGKSATIELKGGKRMLSLSRSTNDYSFGDLDDTNNGNRMIIHDAAQTFNWITSLGTNIFTVDVPAKTMTYGNGIIRWLSLSASTNLYQMGDVDNGHNGTRLLIDDAGKSFVIFGSPTNQRLLSLSEGTSNYSFGDLDAIANGNRMIIDDAAQDFNFKNVASGVLFHARAQGIQTLPPTGGGGQGEWQLGQKVAAVVVFDAANYIEVNIDGVLYKLALAV